ncbi:MAG TPA: hypothetical protein VMV33_01205 [Rhodocyclaceae bacterium]|nr:hypothetical protein [Rhodocyclaceae bacterium]
MSNEDVCIAKIKLQRGQLNNSLSERQSKARDAFVSAIHHFKSQLRVQPAGFSISF